MRRLLWAAQVVGRMVTVIGMVTVVGAVASAGPLEAQAGLVTFASHINKYAAALRLEQVETLPSGKHAEVVMAMENSRPTYILRYDSAALAQPELLIRPMAYVQTVYLNLSASYGRMELQYNASMGSRAAMADREYQDLRFSYNLNAVRFAKSFLATATDNLDAKVDALTAHYEEEKARTQKLVNQAAKEVRAKDRKLQKARSESGILDALEAQELKLNDLVVRNDRAGVAKMLEAYLPFDVMEPFEAKIWAQWVEAIRHPDWKNTVVAIRGVDYETDKVQRLQLADGSEKLGFLSTVLTKNQGNYTRRLRSLTTNRQQSEDDIKPTKLLTDQYWNHSADPRASNFISFTLDPQVASGFVGAPKFKKNSIAAGGGVLAVRMDSRRLFPNMSSGLQGEIEYLAALIIFPDEVVSYKEIMSYQDSARVIESVVEEVKAKTGVTLVEQSGSLAEERFAKAGAEAFKRQLEAPGFGAPMCSGIFR
ncbi:hypothetical protein B9G69_004485 [Bdellovibrio sp. SKB1291214]|uniref:hypothetical protein n=1 Tax=Bdellovibrio sp. SKB1291214 TaxID=1732569 RepID=UPI00223F8239|nr:hypothetical protein [Bdellovibrio sp. SKB1291214]UYL09832.1 hypothetical protein B9G69_004485 [Bdellovibrio sp. SKB1291214]